ncbi:jg18402 [Pararge aegeria aegeria]|uniref:Jg18402 protein n=1 Tax=Pararge aegeria aegeria TaxID=348720 RepID=A0A8S4R869_9NEOP|nr:jg18402 [Pararge aegeria aegeria]
MMLCFGMDGVVAGVIKGTRDFTSTPQGLLSLCPSNILNRRHVSGAVKLSETRPVSEGRQIFETNPSLWPLNQPIPKLEALIQCAGESSYTEDIPTLPKEVFAAFVLTTVGLGTIDRIDPSRALESWNFKAYNAVTDTPSNSWCRSPGTLENVAMAELILERISYELNLDTFDVRLANLDTTNHSDLQEMAETMKNNSQYTERKAAVEKFNLDNRWKKRGLKASFLRWTPIGYTHLDVNMSVYSDDGSVAIAHAGVEMGQGINTRAAQVCAYLLKIPLEKIQIKPNDTTIGPNVFPSGGSLTSQNVSVGIRRCCEELLSRLEPVRSQMNNPTWEELIKKAYEMEIDLQVHNLVNTKDIQSYHIYGIALAEVEVDGLTGEWQFIRADILEDTGRSVNPEIDVGQVEGAFIMGTGYWTSENLVYNPDTGELLTNRTWEYWVPQARDIPQDFRIYFRKRSFSNDVILGAKGLWSPRIDSYVAIRLSQFGSFIATLNLICSLYSVVHQSELGQRFGLGP